MTQQHEALRIADELLALHGPTEIDERAADELRRLHEENKGHRRAQASIYAALATDNPDRDEWPAMIKAQHDRITTLEAALRQAVEALESVYGKGKRCEAAITTAKQALKEKNHV